MPSSRPQAPVRQNPASKRGAALVDEKNVRKSARKPRIIYAAELPVDSPKIRQMARQSATRLGFKLATGLIITICVLGLLKVTVQETILKNPQFALVQIAVDTSGPLSVDKIARTTLLTHGENLLFINMREVRARLRQLPAVTGVALERDFDKGVLTLRVAQRRPVAWLACPRLGMAEGRAEGCWLVDSEGATFPCDYQPDNYAALPVIHHERLQQNTPGLALDDLSLRSALHLVKELDRRHEDGQPQARAMHIQTPWSILVQFSDKTQVIFGVDELERQLARLDQFWFHARQRRWDVDTLNLAVSKNVPVTFRSPPDLAGLGMPAANAATTTR
ncbi:MAG TPA: hypothetical protein DIT13_06045 [Verrucomicrobiales bacterium]|nr:hypothetical protein [Verrucomicrobiales bacterium]HRJ08539.1 cell division protein FtsQ/DivIB [Prosthecobacter sp.]HRK12806.1 cell division protein FtsQ/DivIB [Prosthecobacter sp.]